MRKGMVVWALTGVPESRPQRERRNKFGGRQGEK
jgi:hypothetical protein